MKGIVMDENKANTPDTAGQAQQEPEQQTTGEKTTGYQVARGTLGVYRGAGTGWDGKSYVDDWKIVCTGNDRQTTGGLNIKQRRLDICF